jgi:hypothetical protein
MDNNKSVGAFAHPDIDDSVIEATKEYLRQNEPTHPYKVICSVAESECISKNVARKAVRKLRLSNQIVPAEPFRGDIQLASSER